MKKIKIFFLLSVFLLLGLVLNFANAQTDSNPSNAQVKIVATVNIYNAKIVSQNENVIKIGFDLSNREGVQPQIKYAVELVEKLTEQNKNPQIVDSFVYPETVILGENQTIQKEINYTIPGYLRGSYDVWVIARNDKSLPLGQGMAGNVTLNGNGEYVEIISKSCYLTVNNGSDRYILSQGVDIDPEENLFITCDILNNFKNKIEIIPHWETYFRSTFGKLVKEENQETFSLNAGEKITKIFPVDKASDSQAYDVKLNFLSGNKSISNDLVFHYVLQGESATIKSFRLNKDFYQKGEIADATIYWTGSANIFPGARKEEAKVADYFAVIQINDQSGKTCINSFKEKLNSNGRILGDAIFKIPIVQDCQNPKVSVEIVDGEGKVLDSSSFDLKKNETNEAKSDQAGRYDEYSQDKQGFLIIVIVSSVALILAVVCFFLYSKRRNKFLGMVIFTFLISGTLLFVGNKAYADTFSVRPTDAALEEYVKDAAQADYSVSFDRTSYYTGDTVYVNLSVTKVSTCFNGYVEAAIDAQFPPSYSLNQIVSTSSVYNFQTSFTAPSASGTYPAYFYGYAFYMVYDPLHHGYGRGGDGAKLYLQVNPRPVNGACGSSNGQTLSNAPITNLCNSGSTSAVSGSGPWTWSCYGSGGGANVSCIANKCVSNCSSGPLCGGQANGCGGTCPKNTFSAQCGNATSKVWDETPDSDLCSGLSVSSTSPSIIDGKWTWDCLGCNNGNSVSATCIAKRDINMKEVSP